MAHETSRPADATTLKQYRLPESALAAIRELAAEADILLVGEVHGTQEVPRVVAGLLPVFSQACYGTLALEVPYVAREHLAAYSAGYDLDAPEFFAAPFADGRGNAQALELAKLASSPPHRWAVLCFDQGPDQVMHSWTDRDRFTAENLINQHAQLSPERKVLGICGNLHARVTDVLPSGYRAAAEARGERLWPSFAGWLQQLDPERIVRSINVVFHGGHMFNVGVRPVVARPCAPAIAELELQTDLGYSAILHLPKATPATFLAPPRTFL